MTNEQSGYVKNSIGRMVFVLLALLIQVGWVIFTVLRLSGYSTALNLALTLVAMLLVLHICGKNQNSAFKLPWIILLLASPILGLCLYLLFGHKGVTLRMRKRFEALDSRLMPRMEQRPEVFERLEAENRTLANQCRYLYRFGRFPVYRNTDVRFFAQASDGFEAQLAALAEAESFIFLEYHAIEEASAFARLKAVLADRVAHGVEVRILYDDIGSAGFLDTGFIRRMGEIGVQCRVFNQLRPALNFFMNNRDHRKLTVIDGKTGFTGGYNLADEYFNITHPFGHWKDTGVQLTGEAVTTLTVLFLEMWNAIRETDTEVSRYFPPCAYQAEEDGYLQPYADSPLDDEPTGENVYLNLIKSAQHSFYLSTPYLIISDEMARELTLAAQRGVDVRVITPGIPDKKLIYRVTRSYYPVLARKGVRIFEYTPGFLHEKQVLCDGETAAVGTINFDYRSLYHHFENGVLLHGYRAVEEIGADFEATFPLCREVTERYASGRGAFLHLGQCVLRLLAPLL